MTENFDLIQEISLDNYNIKLYKFISDTTEISIDFISSLQSELNTKIYTKDIIQLLQNQNGITKIEIFDKNNNLITSSSLLIIEE